MWSRSRSRSPRLGFAGVPLNYQERRIYHWHAELDRRIGMERVPEHLRVPPVLDDWVERGLSLTWEQCPSPPWRERGNVSSSQIKKLDTFPLCAASAAGWVAPTERCRISAV